MKTALRAIAIASTIATASAADPVIPISVDFQQPSRTFRITGSEASAMQLNVTLLQAGKAFQMGGGTWTAKFSHYTSMTATTVVQTTTTTNTGSNVLFNISAAHMATSGTRLAAITIQSPGGNVYTFGKGTLVLTKNPATTGAYALPQLPTLAWNLYNYSGTSSAPWYSGTNDPRYALAADVGGGTSIPNSGDWESTNATYYGLQQVTETTLDGDVEHNTTTLRGMKDDGTSIRTVGWDISSSRVRMHGGASGDFPAGMRSAGNENWNLTLFDNSQDNGAHTVNLHDIHTGIFSNAATNITADIAIAGAVGYPVNIVTPNNPAGDAGKIILATGMNISDYGSSIRMTSGGSPVFDVRASSLDVAPESNGGWLINPVGPGLVGSGWHYDTVAGGAWETEIVNWRSMTEKVAAVVGGLPGGGGAWTGPQSAGTYGLTNLGELVGTRTEEIDQGGGELGHHGSNLTIRAASGVATAGTGADWNGGGITIVGGSGAGGSGNAGGNVTIQAGNGALPGSFVYINDKDAGERIRAGGDAGFKLRLNGWAYFPEADGTAGQVLTTDGAGHLSFVDAGGAGSANPHNIPNKGPWTITNSGDSATMSFVDDTSARIEGTVVGGGLWYMDGRTLQLGNAYNAGNGNVLLQMGAANEGDFTVTLASGAILTMDDTVGSKQTVLKGSDDDAGTIIAGWELTPSSLTLRPSGSGANPVTVEAAAGGEMKLTDQAANNSGGVLLKNLVRWVAVPASASATGSPGDAAYESGYLYICVAADTWERVAIATW